LLNKIANKLLLLKKRNIGAIRSRFQHRSSINSKSGHPSVRYICASRHLDL